MLLSHKLDIERSEKRERLNEIASMEGELSAEVRSEVKDLNTAMSDLETKYRAAVMAEEKDANTPEAREAKELEDGLSIRNYLHCAITGAQLEGRESEWNSEKGLAANAVPYEAIAPRKVETRADVVTPGPTTNLPTSWRNIMQRVFAESATAFLGASMESVPVGVSAYPFVSQGTSAELKAADALKESTAATISVKEAKPTRLQARYSFRREDTALVPSLEDALRADLRSALSDELDSQVIMGNGTAPNFSGFLATEANGGLKDAAGSFAPAGVVDFPKWISLMAACVDGKLASTLSALKVLVGLPTYTKLASTFATNTAESALSYSNDMLGGIRASAHMPAVASHKQLAIVTRGADAAFKVPVWSGDLTLIRDEVSDASRGWLHITALSLVGFVRVRDDGALKVNPVISS